ncbi:MAG: YncE family protein [Bacillota bacterium]
MKRFFGLSLCLLLLLPLNAQAAPPSFLLLDQLGNRVEVVGADFKLISSFNTGPAPTSIVSLPDGQGYLLLCRGSATIFGGFSKSGSLLYLDSQLKPGAKNVSLPGIVVTDIYLKDTATWIIVTKNKNGAPTPAAIDIFNLQTGSDTRFDLNSIPTAYRFNSDNSELALTTIGSPKSPPQLVLLQLADLKLKTFPVAANPGGIYFINKQQIMVACGGFRPSSNYSSAIPVEKLDKSVNASLYWIDTESGAAKITPLGYSPLVVVQDENQPEVFYTACSDIAYGKESEGTFRKIKDGEILSEVKFPAEATQLIQTQQGTICLLGREEFFLLNQEGTALLANQNFGLKVAKILLNTDETRGYLSVVNSSSMSEINLQTGEIVQKLKIRGSGLSGLLNIGNLLPDALPPVSGTPKPADDKPIWAAVNEQVLLNNEQSLIYSLASNGEVRALDTKTGQIISSVKFRQGKPYGIHLTPDQKYLVIATDSIWYLVDPVKNRIQLKIPLLTGDYPPDTGFYSPDGSLLVIPGNGYFYLVDCQTGKLAGKFRTKIQKALVAWLE